MTHIEFSHLLIDLIGLMAEINYSQDIIETTLGLMLPLTTENRRTALLKFIEIAKLKLPERDYHYEISQVFKELMGYPPTLFEIEE